MSQVEAFPETVVDPGLDLDRRYTLRTTDAWCRDRARVEAWTMDVAADEESHLAETWYGVEQNGLARPWFGNVWCNPPFSDIEPWVRKAWREWTLRERMTSMGPFPDVIAMLLPCNRTEQDWSQQLVEPYRDRPDQDLRTHFLPGRTRYGHPGNREGVGVGSPAFGSVLLVWR